MVLIILELVMFFSGLYMLITGKTIGKDPIKHMQVRLLGLVLICEFPFVLFCGLAMGIYVALTDPAAVKSGTMPTWFLVTGAIIEWGSYLICAAIWTAWTKRIKAKFAPPLAPPPGLAPGALAHPVAPQAAAAPEEPDEEFADEDDDDGQVADEDDDVEQPPVNR